MKEQFGGGPLFMEPANTTRGKDKLPGTGLHEAVENQVRQSSKVQWQGAPADAVIGL